MDCKVIVLFRGYIQYKPGRWKPKFEIIGHSLFPDYSLVDFETLMCLRIPIPQFKGFLEWRRERFSRELKNGKTLKGVYKKTMDELSEKLFKDLKEHTLSYNERIKKEATLAQIFEEFRAELKRLRLERDLYRERLISELVVGRPNYTRDVAALDVDSEVLRYLGRGS